MENKYYMLRILLLSGLFFSIQASATYITFTAEGTDNIPHNFTESRDPQLDLDDPSANFFNITFNDGYVGEYISQIVIDLRAGTDDDAYFDPNDGNANADDNSGGGKGYGPVIGSNTFGLSLGEVRFSLGISSKISPVLKISFDNNSFTPGDSLSFGIDIDYLDAGMNNQAGGLLGAASVGLMTTLYGTCQGTVSSTFVKESENRSTSQINICEPIAVVPNVSEPNILLLLLSGLGLAYFFRAAFKLF